MNHEEIETQREPREEHGCPSVVALTSRLGLDGVGGVKGEQTATADPPWKKPQESIIQEAGSRANSGQSLVPDLWKPPRIRRSSAVRHEGDLYMNLVSNAFADHIVSRALSHTNHHIVPPREHRLNLWPLGRSARLALPGRERPLPITK